jgi:hypothetical protein
MSSLYRSILNVQGSSFASTNSFEFDGSTDYVEVADNSNLSFGNGTTDSPFSISCWVNVSNFTNSHMLFRKRGPSGAFYNWEYDTFISNDGAINFRLFDVGSTVRVGRKTNTGLITTNTWNNIVFTYDGQGGSTAYNGIKIYLNGIRVDSVNLSLNTYVAMHNLSSPVEIGERTAGNIDEVSIFNTELSASDITSIYNNGVPNDLNDLSTPPLSWWRMGEAANYSGGTWTLTDQGSGGNNGTSTTLPAPPAQPSTDVPT